MKAVIVGDSEKIGSEEQESSEESNNKVAGPARELCENPDKMNEVVMK